jgi:hypothetical protein
LNRTKDPQTIECGKGYPVLRRIRCTRSLRANIVFALSQLLKGPTAAEESLGYRSSVPTREEIKKRKRLMDEEFSFLPKEKRVGQFWIDDNDTIVVLKRVKLTRDSVFVEFSKSMIAYGGGSCRVAGIVGPMGQTILQFPSIKKIGFSIEGTPKGELPFQP